MLYHNSRSTHFKVIIIKLVKIFALIIIKTNINKVINVVVLDSVQNLPKFQKAKNIKKLSTNFKFRTI